MTDTATARSPLRSAIVVWTARTAAPLVRMGVVVLVSRWLGAAGLGAYQVLLATLAVFETIPGLGLWPLIVRRVAREPEEARRYLVNGCALSIGASLLLVAPMALAGRGYDAEVQQGMLILAGTLAPAVVILVSEAILIARGRPEGIAVLRVVENLVLVAATAAVLVAGRGIVAVCGAMLVTRIGCAAAAFAWALHRCPPTRVGLRWGLVRELLAETPVYIGLSITWALYTRIDVLMLSRLVALDEVGYYGAGQRLLTMGQEIPQSIVTVVMPMLAAGYARDPEQYRRLVERTLRYFLAFAVPAAVGGMMLGGRVVVMLFGDTFAPAIPCAVILLWSFVPFCVMKLLGSALLAADAQRADLVINLTVLVATIAVLAALVPGGGATGAAWAMFASVTLSAALRWGVVARRAGGLRIEPRTAAVVPAGLAMAGALLAVRECPLVVALVLGPLVYAGALLACGGFTSDELAAVPLLGGRRGRRLAGSEG